MSWLVGCVLSSVLIVAAVGEAFADAEADPACNNCGQRPPYIKGARVSTNAEMRAIFSEMLYLRGLSRN